MPLTPGSLRKPAMDFSLSTSPALSTPNEPNRSRLLNPTNIVCRPPIDSPASARPFGWFCTLYWLSTSGIDVLAQLGLEGRERELDVPRVVAMDDLVVGDGDDHRHDLPLGQQVVHDQVHAAVVDPVVGQVAAAADQVEHRVLPRPVVAGRRVDVQLALAVRHAGVIDVARHRAVRHVAGVVVGRRRRRGPPAGCRAAWR